MTVFLLALFIGFVAGLRSMTALCVVSMAAHAGWLQLEETPVAPLGHPFAVCGLLLLAGAEMICDLLMQGHSRKQPAGFTVRLISGALCGAALGASGRAPWGGVLAGTLGAVCGTLAGADFRRWLSGALGQDTPAAVTENAVAIGAAALVMAGLG